MPAKTIEMPKQCSMKAMGNTGK